MSRFALINLQGGLLLAVGAANCGRAPMMLIPIDSFHVEIVSYSIHGSLIYYPVESVRFLCFFFDCVLFSVNFSLWVSEL